jgi:hypothetical protein
MKPLHVIIQTRAPRGSHPGACEEGFYHMVRDEVTLTTQDGTVILDNRGHKISALVEPGQNPKQVAARLLRSTLGHGARTSGFGAPIHYPKSGVA